MQYSGERGEDEEGMDVGHRVQVDLAVIVVTGHSTVQ